MVFSYLQKLFVLRANAVWGRLWPWPSFNLNAPGRHVTKEVLLEAYKHLKRGDVILTRSNGYLSNLFIGGEYTHASIYVGESFKGQYKHGIVQAITEGAQVEEFSTLLTAVDSICIMRLIMPITPKEQEDTICKRAKNTVNRHVEYDYEFKLGESNSLYCSELVVLAYKLMPAAKVRFQRTIKLGKAYYEPSKFLDPMYWEKVWER